MLAVWVRFYSGWIPLKHETLPPYILYVYGAGVITLLFLFIYRSLGLYVRPQTGSFGDKLPRLVRATGWGILLATALAFIIRTEPPFSRVTAGMSFFTIAILVVLERYILFRAEIYLARRRTLVNRIAIIGTDEVAAHLRHVIEKEPRLRSRVVAFLRTPNTGIDPAIAQDLIRGKSDDLEALIENKEIDQVILADTSISHSRMVQIILFCERGLIPFLMVPDLFGVLTSKVSVRHVGDVPLLGVSKWPMDYFWNRLLKRLEDVVGSAVGLLISAPIVAIAALLIKRTSPGPVFYRQVRCGEGGREFVIYKLRTMKDGAEDDTGPRWAVADDPRRTGVGAFLRRHNLDELPQFWNVFKGDMSMVGPRPERPHFVEQFKEDVGRYMWRHASKPGITGWAQINGLRGNTSIAERIKYDLYYLENWSLSLDFKILVQTFFSRENAY
ncbi:MAG: undecaprenyl-phosphate glucose phosphotransferase [Lentisphaerae bacterium GWF2_57_35]|nr:MAG: undecaprenyl-phosphate glucose phosphotransferase [Lentisphaerae bacterium GWF2_57_35]